MRKRLAVGINKLTQNKVPTGHQKIKIKDTPKTHWLSSKQRQHNPLELSLEDQSNQKWENQTYAPQNTIRLKKKNNLQELQPQLFSIQPTHSQQKIQEYPFSFPQNKPKDFTTPIRPSHRKSSKKKKPRKTATLQIEQPRILRNRNHPNYGETHSVSKKFSSQNDPNQNTHSVFYQKISKQNSEILNIYNPKRIQEFPKLIPIQHQKKKKSKTPNLFSVQTIPEKFT
jgi:hypothetical protein